jgi:hypothetical protein
VAERVVDAATDLLVGPVVQLAERVFDPSESAVVGPVVTLGKLGQRLGRRCQPRRLVVRGVLGCIGERVTGCDEVVVSHMVDYCEHPP